VTAPQRTAPASDAGHGPELRTAGPGAGGQQSGQGVEAFPLAALLVMALAGFVLLATETMPAGLLPQISAGMGTTEARAGQLVSAYALGTVLATLPAVAWTRSRRRKPVLLLGLVGFLAANAVVTVSGDITLSYAARFVAGAFSGLLWGMLAGYAGRITSPARAGRALAVASIGTPLGLAVGTPLGSWVGTTLDWRWAFAGLTLLTLATLVLAIALVPDAPGQASASHTPLLRVFALPGVAPILAVIAIWMVAHNISYTYIAPYLSAANVGLSAGLVLVVFGGAALVGLALTGAFIDRALRRLSFTSIGLCVLAGAVLLAGHSSKVAVLLAVAPWGIAYGGAATLLQTAIADASGENGDVANSMLGVAFNLAIFAAGVLGAVLISTWGGLALPVVMIALALIGLAVAVMARTTAFPCSEKW
jgi:predicted MFS family arabinose efflux permease